MNSTTDSKNDKNNAFFFTFIAWKISIFTFFSKYVLFQHKNIINSVLVDEYRCIFVFIL